MSVAQVLLAVLFLGMGDDPGLDPLSLRGLRERLSSSRLTDVQQALADMESAPHRSHGLLLFEALLRAVRSVEVARERLPELESEILELKANYQESRKSSSPSILKRLEKQITQRSEEEFELRASLQLGQAVDHYLIAALARISASLTDESRSRLANELISRSTSLRTLTERITLYRLLGKVHSSASIIALMQRLREPQESSESRIVILEGLGAQRNPMCLPAVMLCLQEKDWRVVSEAVEVVRLLHQRTSIPTLIELLGAVKGRLLDDVCEALRSLTGQTLASDASTWRRWWEEHLLDFQMPAAAAARVVAADQGGVGTHFYGITTQSRGVLFVLDVSGSMNDPAKEYGNQSAKKRSIDVARLNLRATITSLPADAKFNVILYSDDVVSAFEVPVTADQAHREKALAFMEAREPRGGTNLHGGLAHALRMAANGDWEDGFSMQIDTMFMLTDGRPTAGAVLRADQILAEVRSLNLLRRVKIHCVGIGDHDEVFLRALAEQNRGQYEKR